MGAARRGHRAPRKACARPPGRVLHRLQPSFRAALPAHAGGHRLRSAGEAVPLQNVLRKRDGPPGARIGLARPGGWRSAGPGFASARYRGILVRRSGQRFSGAFRQLLREPCPGSSGHWFALHTAAAATGDDAAVLAQSLHLRPVRRARLRAHPVPVQMGADHVYPAHPSPAFGEAARGNGYAHAGRSDLVCRARAFQIALRASRINRCFARPLDAEMVAWTRRTGDEIREGMSGILVGFVGMTHLGVNSAAAALARCFGVVGYDADRDMIEGLRRGDAHVVEPGLPEVLRRHASRANYTANVADLSRCDLVYIASDVPTDDCGASDLAGIRRLVEAVSGALARDAVVMVLWPV